MHRLFFDRAAKFFLVQQTKTEQNIPNDQKYTKWAYNIPNDRKIHQEILFQGPPKYIHPNWDYWYAKIRPGNPVFRCLLTPILPNGSSKKLGSNAATCGQTFRPHGNDSVKSKDLGKSGLARREVN
jgi:hypothetical protein